jgi:hypothetical protein
MGDPSTILASAPFPLALRNFVPTGLVGELERRFGLRVHFVSPYQQAEFTDAVGRTYANSRVAATQGAGGLPAVAGVTALDRALKSVHLTGFALEYPDGSLQNLELSRRRNGQRVIAEVLRRLAPRGSARREWLRSLYGLYRPIRPNIAAVFDEVRPSLVLVSSPGHFWLDHFVLDEARRRGIPSVCIVLSWDNLYSRGPLCRRPDRLLVWSEEMRRQALEVHQFPAERTAVVGPLQFLYYDAPVSAAEAAAMRTHVGLGPDEPYLAYVCGSRTAEYDVEDVLALLQQLAQGPFARLRVVVRPHPQGSRTAYERLPGHGVLLDRSPDLTSDQTHPEAINVAAIRHMASLLDGARFVVSSWGTTALLEACIFDTPSVQLRWMDAVPHSLPDQVRMVRDFQRYIHMRAFDETGARPYCDHPRDLNSTLAELEARREEYAARRARAVTSLTSLPLSGVVDRVCVALQSLVRPRRGVLVDTTLETTA